MPHKIKILPAISRQNYAHCVRLRFEVFVQEQGVPADIETDEFEDDSMHYLALADGNQAGTVRYRMKDKQTIKIERLAVLEKYRGKNIGAALMEHVIEAAQEDHPDAAEIILSSQLYAIPFYERFGFVARGDEYDDGGIPHKTMHKPL